MPVDNTNLAVEKIDMQKIPKHIAIIMDGNGRWAKRKGLPRIAGHWAGAEALKDIVSNCYKLNIQVLSVFAFSSENWKRPTQEVNSIMNLLLYYLKKEVNTLHKNHVRIIVTGNWQELPDSIVEQIGKSIRQTQNNSGLILNIVLNYGARKEIILACKNICRDVLEGKISINKIDEVLFEQCLYTRDLPDPDLLIRPSGELRISNFLLWQIAYTELWFTEIYWPDFRTEDLLQAIYDYQRRERRFGGLKK
ncbi:MAG TPA: isoprenyl transferase [Thermoanaerobacterales bacterium]|nr:isoprenyl transferase [Thermoanaerobacterales bacterium]